MTSALHVPEAHQPQLRGDVTRVVEARDELEAVELLFSLRNGVRFPSSMPDKGLNSVRQSNRKSSRRGTFRAHRCGVEQVYDGSSDVAESSVSDTENAPSLEVSAGEEESGSGSRGVTPPLPSTSSSVPVACPGAVQQTAVVDLQQQQHSMRMGIAMQPPASGFNPFVAVAQQLQMQGHDPAMIAAMAQKWGLNGASVFPAMMQQQRQPHQPHQQPHQQQFPASVGAVSVGQSLPTSGYQRQPSSRGNDVAAPKSRRTRLPPSATHFLKQWIFAHAEHPYPTEQDKLEFCERTGLTLNQINNWFTNARRRILPLIPSPSAQKDAASTQE